MPDKYRRRTLSEINSYLWNKIAMIKEDFFVFGEHGRDEDGNEILIYTPRMFDLGEGASPFSGDPNRRLNLGSMVYDPNMPKDEINSVRWNDPETRHLRLSDDEPRYHCLKILVHAAPGGPDGSGCGKFLDRKLFKEYEYNQIKNEKQDDNSRLFNSIKYDETMSYENKLELIGVLQEEDPEYLSAHIKESLPELKAVLEIEQKIEMLEEEERILEEERGVERFCVGPGGVPIENALPGREFELPAEPGEEYYTINNRRPRMNFAQALPPPPGHFVVSPPAPSPAAIALSYAAGMQGQDNVLQKELPQGGGGQRVKRRTNKKKKKKKKTRKRRITKSK